MLHHLLKNFVTLGTVLSLGILALTNHSHKRTQSDPAVISRPYMRHSRYGHYWLCH